MRKALVSSLLLLVSVAVPPRVPSAAPGGVPQEPTPAGAARAGAPGATQGTAAADVPRTIAPYFTPASTGPKPADADGFLRRWLLLEPITKPNRTNTVFTDSYVRNTFATEYFPGQFTAIPHDGDKVTVDGRQLAWHAVDSSTFNVKLFRDVYVIVGCRPSLCRAR